MIKNQDGRFYITSGNACYCMNDADGGLCHVCFGKRVEYEDDINSLVPEALPEIADGDIVLKRSGKKLNLKLRIAGSRVESNKPSSVLPSLRGDKTLIVELADDAAKVRVDVLFTPYSRGGIAKRLTVVNLGSTPLTVERLAVGVWAQSAFFKGRFGPAVSVTSGGAVGAFPLFPTGVEEISERRFVIAAVDAGRNGETVKLDAGGALSSAELLAVYAESAGGVVRALHDIIRDHGISSNKVDRRRPIVLYCAGGDGLDGRVAAACEMGVDTVVVDYGDGDERRAAECIHSHGVKFGLRIAVGAKASDVIETVKECGVEYLEFGFDGVTTYSSVAALFGAYVELSAEFPELVTDIVAGESGERSVAERLKARALSPLPLAAVRNVVALNGDDHAFKTEFDIATLGGLGYRLDPSTLGEGFRRAVQAQIFSYQDDAGVIRFGDVYDIGDGVMAVSKDKSKAYAVVFGAVRLVGLDEHNLYYVRELGKTFTGAALLYYGIPKDHCAAGVTVTYHIRQVADYEQ